MFGLFLSIAVPPSIVSSFTLVHSKVLEPAQQTSSLKMVVSTNLDLENFVVSPGDEVRLSDELTVGTLCKDVASHACC